VRERRKEPREGSEIEPETVCLQGMGGLCPAPFLIKEQVMWFVYVLIHDESGNIYIGVSSDVDKRLKAHNEGLNPSTRRKSGKWEILYYEAYQTKAKAFERENRLKSHGKAKQELLKRLDHNSLNKKGAGNV
jgi:putative endonuclease